MTSDGVEDWSRLGRYVRERRADMRLTQGDVQANGGPSAAKIREIENGRTETLTASKRRDLDRALDWIPGSVDAILAGGEPTEVPLPIFGKEPPRDLAAPRYQNDPASTRAEGRIRSAIRLLDGASDALTNFAHHDAIANLDSATVVIKAAIDTIENIAEQGDSDDLTQESTSTSSTSKEGEGEKNGAGGPRGKAEDLINPDQPSDVDADTTTDDYDLAGGWRRGGGESETRRIRREQDEAAERGDV